MYDIRKLIDKAGKMKERIRIVDLASITHEPLTREVEREVEGDYVKVKEVYGAADKMEGEGFIRHIDEDLRSLRRALVKMPWHVEELARMNDSFINSAGEWCDSWGY
jgi:hypothetical protein